MWPHTIHPLGDRALTIDFPEVDSAVIRDLLRTLETRVQTDAPPGVTARVPAIRTLTLHYEPTRTSYDTLRSYIGETLIGLTLIRLAPREPVVIPVCYGGEFGPDLTDVAAAHDTSPADIVEAHTAGRYTVAMLGFLPGFPYLDGLDAALHTPRRGTPRTSVPAGSVGIGGSSTGVYPFASPGGWQIIGRTPIALFEPERTPPALLQAGDQVRFIAITDDELRRYAAVA